MNNPPPASSVSTDHFIRSMTTPTECSIDGANTTCTLAKLPEELLSNIAAKLGSSGIFAFRLTCKDIEEKTFHEFAREYFSVKCFMFTTESLRVLHDIANSGRLRRFLFCIYISTAPIPRDGEQPGYHVSKLPVRYSEAYKFYVADQKQLFVSGKDKQMLVEAFRKLPKVTSLRFVNDISRLPLTVDCSGLSKFTRTTNCPAANLSADVSFMPDFSEWSAHIWQTTISAIAESETGSFRELRTDFFGRYFGLPGMNQLSLNDANLKSLSHSFRKLREVVLQLQKRASRKDEYGAITTKMMRKFATTLSSATSFDLTFNSGRSSGACCKAFTSGLNLGKIVSLRINELRIDVDTLTKMIQSLTSVRFLILACVDLTEGSWTQILHNLKKLPSLVHLHLAYLSEVKSKAYFLQQADSSNEFDLADAPGASNSPPQAGGDDGEGATTAQPIVFPPFPTEFAMESSDEADGWFPEEYFPVDTMHTCRPRPTPDMDKFSTDPQRDHEKKCTFRTEDFKAPWLKGSQERGYYICLSGQELADFLPIFIKEYNVYDGASMVDQPNNIATAIFEMGMPPPSVFPPLYGLPFPAAPTPATSTQTVAPNGPQQQTNALPTLGALVQALQFSHGGLHNPGAAPQAANSTAGGVGPAIIPGGTVANGGNPSNSTLSSATDSESNTSAQVGTNQSESLAGMVEPPQSAHGHALPTAYAGDGNNIWVMEGTMVAGNPDSWMMDSGDEGIGSDE